MSKASEKKEIGFVLLHGAGYGSWMWDKVIPHLNASSLAIDFPGREHKKVPDIEKLTLADYTQSVIDDLSSFNVKKYIIVAHSFSGLVALDIATQFPDKVKSIVFLTAAVPETGKSFLSLLPFPQQLLLRVMLRFSPRPPEAAIRQECKGLDDQTIKMVLKKYVTESTHIWFDPVFWNIPRELPRYYLRDESSFPHNNNIENIHPKKVISIHTGHLSMLIQPKEIASLLNSFL